jgi:hypothetical protein
MVPGSVVSFSNTTPVKPLAEDVKVSVHLGAFLGCSMNQPTPSGIPHLPDEPASRRGLLTSPGALPGRASKTNTTPVLPGIRAFLINALHLPSQLFAVSEQEMISLRKDGLACST